MTSPFPASYSTPSPAAVAEEILPQYAIGAVIECRLHMSGVNDIYCVRTGTGPYILKVYRASWRSEPEVLYELDLLTHLHRKGVSVSLPVTRRDDRWITPLPAPEGVRQSVLFISAPGRPPRWPFHEDEAESHLMGGALAAIHNAGDDFTSPHSRFPLDEAFLLDRTLAAVRPFLAHREEDWRYLLDLTERLRQRLRDLASRELSYGICHGDFHGGNAFIDGQTVTTFDFDVCAAGWLAFDLARWKADSEGKNSSSWTSFLKGYQETRRLSEADLEAVPLFILLRTFDWMRIKTTFTANGEWDCWDMDFYFNDTLANLKQRESKALGTTPMASTSQ
jgi:Ser/Thr protein kinase RdoA (MazF antagonist)